MTKIPKTLKGLFPYFCLGLVVIHMLLYASSKFVIAMMKNFGSDWSDSFWWVYLVLFLIVFATAPKKIGG